MLPCVFPEVRRGIQKSCAAPMKSKRPTILRMGCATFLLLFGLSAARADEGVLAAPAGEIILTITGNIARTNHDDMAVFDEEMLASLPTAVLETTTVVTDGVRRFDGFLVRDLLDRVGADGETVTAIALNDYVIDIPMADFERFEVIAATHMDGDRLLRSDKGPLWIVYPRDDHVELQDIRYDYRWVWQLIELDVK